MVIITRNPQYNILEAAEIIIKDRKLLVFKGKDTFVSPGGKLIFGETPKEGLVRELSEEIGIKVDARELHEFGSYSGEAATSPVTR